MKILTKRLAKKKRPKRSYSYTFNRSPSIVRHATGSLRRGFASYISVTHVQIQPSLLAPHAKGHSRRGFASYSFDMSVILYPNSARTVGAICQGRSIILGRDILEYRKVLYNQIWFFICYYSMWIFTCQFCFMLAEEFPEMMRSDGSKY